MTQTVFLAAAAALSLMAMPAQAELTLSVGTGFSFDKHELQGGGPTLNDHFSLTDTSESLLIEVTRPDALRIGNRPVSASVSLEHNETQSVGTASASRQWIASRNRTVRAITDRAVLTLRMPLATSGRWTHEAGVGLGLSHTKVEITNNASHATRTGTLPHAALSLRSNYRVDDTFRLWAELRYHASPALAVTFPDGTQIRHEISGYELGLGVTVPLGHDF